MADTTTSTSDMSQSAANETSKRLPVQSPKPKVAKKRTKKIVIDDDNTDDELRSSDSEGCEKRSTDDDDSAASLEDFIVSDDDDSDEADEAEPEHDEKLTETDELRIEAEKLGAPVKTCVTDQGVRRSTRAVKKPLTYQEQYWRKTERSMYVQDASVSDVDVTDADVESEDESEVAADDDNDNATENDEDDDDDSYSGDDESDEAGLTDTESESDFEDDLPPKPRAKKRRRLVLDDECSQNVPLKSQHVTTQHAANAGTQLQTSAGSQPAVDVVPAIPIATAIVPTVAVAAWPDEGVDSSGAADVNS